ILGTSVLGKPIKYYKLGTGTIQILAWSQMHGNESTPTKAVFDLIHFFKQANQFKLADFLLKSITFHIIPMLNPDGAESYTRVNANQVDLNRDAQALSQPESRILQALYKQISPDFCFNLHDQRTIFSAGKNPKPATLSFLTPASDPDRKVTSERIKSMQIIAHINQTLQPFLPGQIGRYSDAYNLNCTGDTFQSMGTPTLLFEAGHFQGDYNREETRFFMFCALLSAVEFIAKQQWEKVDYKEYLEIPENQQLFYDIILRNIPVEDNQFLDIGILYKEILEDNELNLTAYVEKIGDLSGFFGHKVFDLKYLHPNNSVFLKDLLGKPATFNLAKNVKIT
ncbi:MAG: M14 family zinc carboxypeptidase, partial [Flavobacteriaceae bacterium]|nr:M14 family zinc carboxypeptidase [Flavobacteriaceae bacterium]